MRFDSGVDRAAGLYKTGRLRNIGASRITGCGSAATRGGFMASCIWIIVWWLAFAGTHLGLSALPVRQPLIARLGERGFQGFYSVVSLATFIPLVRAYGTARHAGPQLWSLGGEPVWHALALVLSALGLLLAVLALVQPSATVMIPGVPVRARGVVRITRHALFMGIALWGLGHTIVNGWLSDVIFFGSFAVFSVVGALHQDARKQVMDGERLRAFYAETSVLPFAAILSGRTEFVADEIPVLGVAAGAAAAVAVYLAHPWLFG
jgi:uncharacterized membrane protein